MIDHQFIGKVAGIIATIGFLPYAIDILRGKKPSKASWIIWSTIGIALALSYESSGAKASLWVAVSYAICPLFILALAFYKDRSPMKTWPTVDKIFLVAGVICFMPWVVFKICEVYKILPQWGWILPRVTLYGGILTDLCGGIPTIIKTYHDPESESFIAWSFWASGNILNLFAVELWVLDLFVYALYLAIPSTLIVARMLIFKAKSKSPAL